MDRKILITNAILIIALFLIGWLSNTHGQGVYLRERVQEFRQELQEKKSQGYDVSEAERLMKEAGKARRRGDEQTAEQLFKASFIALRNAKKVAIKEPEEKYTKGVPAAPETQASRITIIFVEEKPLNGNILGLNTANVRTPYTINHPEIVRLINEANMRFFRFPGGTLSNVYNWRTGYLDEAVKSKLLKRRAISINRSLNKRGKPEKTRIFLDLVKKTNTNFGLVLNFFTLPPGDMGEWIKSIQESGYEVNFCELGNELYMKEYRVVYPDVDSYIEAAKDYTQSVKEHNPKVKCGIVGLQFDPKNPASRKSATKWNEKISREDFYDAVIIHIYSAQAKKSSPPPIEELYLKTIMDTELLYPEVMEYFEAMFPKKEIWVTEWNLGFTPNVEWDIFESMASGLYAAHFLSILFKNPKITMACYHRLDYLMFFHGFKKRYGVIEKDLQKSFITTPPYYAFKLYGYAIKGCDKVSIVNVKGTKNFEDAGGRSIPDIETVGFTGNGKKTLVITNRWDQEYGLDLEGIASRDLIVMERFFGNSLEAKDITYEKPRRIALSDVRIKPFSVTLLEFFQGH